MRESEPLVLVKYLRAHSASKLYTPDTVDSLKCHQIEQDPQTDQRASSQMCDEKPCLAPRLFVFAFWLLLSGCRKGNHLLRDVSSEGWKGCWPMIRPQIEVHHLRPFWLLLAELLTAGLWQCFWSFLLWQFWAENCSDWGRQCQLLTASYSTKGRPTTYSKNWKGIYNLSNPAACLVLLLGLGLKLKFRSMAIWNV